MDTPLRFGLFADPHYADRDPEGTRHYREARHKLAACVAAMNQAKVDFLVCLGDLKDQGEPPHEADTLGYLRDINAVYQEFKGPRHTVLGNHDMDSLSKAQFMSVVGLTQPAYSFDCKGMHFVVLDANYTGDGTDYDRGNGEWNDANIPQEQIDWLENDLARHPQPTILFVHQRLDGEGDYFVNNAAAVRAVLESSGQVTTVFQGHDHRGATQHINGIHYHTLAGMVDGSGPGQNAYAIVECASGDRLSIQGFERAQSILLQ